MNWREVCTQRSGPVNGLLNAPLPFFDTVHQDHQLGNITDVTNFHKDAKAGTLPNVTWITPSGPNSEHPPSKVGDGQAWTISLINAAMQGLQWSIDPSTMSQDAYVKFIDDDF